jgi:O-antigen/teichoic acid export membrane protein
VLAARPSLAPLAALTAVSALHAAAQWLLALVVARYGGPKELGRYSYALAVAAPFVLFAHANLRTLLTIDIAHRYRSADYIGLRLWASIGVLLLLAALSALDFVSSEAAPIILAIAVIRTLEGLSDIVYGFEQREHRSRAVVFSLLLRTAAQLAVFWIGYRVLRLELHVAIAMLGAVTATSFLVLDVAPLRRAMHEQGERLAHVLRGALFSMHQGRLLPLARFAVPLAITAVLASLYQNIPRYVIEQHADLVAVGEYSALFNLVYVVNTFITAANGVFSPLLARAWVSDRRLFWRRVRALSVSSGALGVAGIVAAWFAGAAILRFLYGESFDHLAPQLPWIMLGATAWYVASAFQISAVAAGQLSVQPAVHLAVVAATLLASELLVPRYGVMGAIFGFLTAGSILAIAQAIVLANAGPTLPSSPQATLLGDVQHAS